MKYYEAILELGCFSLSELITSIGKNEKTVKSLLQSYVQKGYVKQIRRNLYTAISLETRAPVASPFQIASKLSPTAYISHRSAFAYYGYVDQVSYEMDVFSESRFNKFEFDGIDYYCISSKCNLGIVEIRGVRVTNIERAVIDYINQFDRIGGLEELLKGLEMIPYLSEEKLMNYLQFYDKSFLYQKAGYILEHYQKELKLSEYFIEECAARKTKSIRYFTNTLPKNRLIYNSKWGLIVPEKLLHISE